MALGVCGTALLARAWIADSPTLYKLVERLREKSPCGSTVAELNDAHARGQLGRNGTRSDGALRLRRRVELVLDQFERLVVGEARVE